MAFLGAAYFFTAWLFLDSFCMLQSWHIAINGCCYLSSFFFMQADICSALHVNHAYFLKNLYIFVYVNDAG